MDTNDDACAGFQPQAKESNWAAAFASGDPARQWAAACSVARVVTGGDDWRDATALHEAAVGAFDAATGSGAVDPVGAAVLGARRAAYWERQARFRLVPPVSFAEHRWRADARVCRDRQVLLEPINEPALLTVSLPAQPRPPSRVAPWLGAALKAAGWRWRPTPVEAVTDAIDIVAEIGRDEAPSEIRRRHPRLPAMVVNNLVLLLAGSRVRDGLSWPGVVWLEAHHGRQAAETDRGTAAVIAALVAERRARPVNVINDTNRVRTVNPIPLRHRSTAHSNTGRSSMARSVAS